MQRTFNLADLFEIVAETVPDRIAFVCGAQQLSFAALDKRATRLGNALRAQGVQRGDNVGIQIYNSAEYLETFFACCKIGAVPANINYRYVADELKQLFFSLDLKALVYSEDFSGEVAKVANQVPTLKMLIQVGTNQSTERARDYETLLSSGASEVDRSGRSNDDLYMLCTGGTTGLPKGVMWPHRALFVGALGGGGMYFGRGPIDHPDDLVALVLSAPPMRYFAIAPMMHGAAMWSSLISLYAGHTVVVNDQHNFDAEHILDLAQTQCVDVLSIVGDAMGQPLLQALEAHSQRWDLKHLKIFGNGGAALSEHLRVRIGAILPHVMFSNGLGSSETGVVGSGEKPANGDGFMVLKARPDLSVIDEQMCMVHAPGALGILARTGCTPIGYYGDKKKSAETFVTINGQLWALSGDQARIDENGNIVVLGRGSQCINTGGEKVFTEEVEDAARRYSVIADVMVVGLPDARWGQKVAAVVQLSSGQSFDMAEFQAICRMHLSNYKVPKEVFVAQQLQRSPAGKADYRWALDFALKQTAVPV